MALLWIEGFEGFGQTTGSAPLPTGIVGRKYPLINREEFMLIQSGRFGYSLVTLGTSDFIQCPNLTTNSTVVMGCAIKITGIPPGNRILVSLRDASNLGIELQAKADGTIAIYRDTTLIGTTTNSMSLNTWFYLELKVFTASDTSGTIELRMNEDVWYLNSGVITQVTANPYNTCFRIGMGPEGYWTYYDDIYFLDASGSVNNDFLGPRKVSVIRPNAAGDDTDWTPDSGNNHDRVKEAVLDGDTSYVETGTTNDQDLYNYEPTVDLTEVSGIQIMTEAKVTAGAMELQTISKSGTTEDAHSCGTIISTDYVTCVAVGELNPDTSLQWTPAEIDAAQFGVKAI